MTSQEDLEQQEWELAINNYRAGVRHSVQELEEKFPERGLKFTLPFTGSIPNVAYGHIDGMRFYFKFRGDCGSLRVGIYDAGIDEKEYQESLELWKASSATRAVLKDMNAEEAEDYEFWNGMTKPKRHSVLEDRVLPNTILAYAELNDFAGIDYNSDLNPEEMVRLFSHLVENLKPTK